MLDASGFLQNLMLVLKRNEQLSDLNFIMGFPSSKKPAPLTKNYVVLGIDSSKEEKKEVYSKDETPVLLSNRHDTARIRFDIFVPETSNGIDCYEIFSNLAGYVMKATSDYKFIMAGCDTVTYERDEGAFVLNAYMDVERFYLKTES